MHEYNDQNEEKDRWIDNFQWNLSRSIINSINELIKIKSISNTKEENEMLEHIHNTISTFKKNNKNKNINIDLKKIGIENEWIYKWWIICNIANPELNENIILMWHVDVVPIKDTPKNIWKTNPFNMYEDEKYLYWRWTCDMKSWLWIMLELIKNITNNNFNQKFNLSFIFSTWEETWLPNWLTEIINNWELPKSDFSITLEPTEWKINIWVFGYMVWKYTVDWVSCHSSNPSLWENAIEKSNILMNTLIEQKDKCEEFNGVKEVFEITKINWWTASNIVPNQVEYTINHRYAPWKDSKEREAYLSEIAKSTDTKLHILEHNPCSLDVPLDNPILLKVIEATKSDISSLNLVPFWSDMAQTSINWIPSINYWPWSIKQAHTSNEFVSKESINEVYISLKNLLFKPI